MSPKYATSTHHTRLPSDEYKHLQHLQKRDRLTAQFAESNRPSMSYNRSNSYRDAGLSQEECMNISKVQNATRAALGPSFDCDDDSYTRSMQHRDNYERSRGWTDDGEYSSALIPQKYLHEYHQHWHGDGEDHNADQYWADFAKDLPWRQPVAIDHVPMPIANPYNHCHEAPVLQRHDSGVALSSSAGSLRLATSHHPIVKSKFSFYDDQNEVETWRKKGLRRLFRRR